MPELSVGGAGAARTLVLHCSRKDNSATACWLARLCGQSGHDQIWLNAATDFNHLLNRVRAILTARIGHDEVCSITARRSVGVTDLASPGAGGVAWTGSARTVTKGEVIGCNC